jgi:hypothetical protein
MIQLPGISAYLVAKYLYIAGSDIIALDSSFESSPTKACAEYSLYSTLTELSQFNGISKYVLGDLEVTRSGEASLYEKWKALADVAYEKILGVGPKYISRESIRQSNPSKQYLEGTRAYRLCPEEKAREREWSIQNDRRWKVRAEDREMDYLEMVSWSSTQKREQEIYD